MNYELCTLIAADLSASIYGFLFSRIVAAGALSPATFYIPAAIGIVNDMMRGTSHRITPYVHRDSRLHSRPHRNRFSSLEQPPQPRLHSMAMLKLAERYSSQRLESACQKALSYTSSPSLKSIQSILKSGQDKLLAEDAPAKLEEPKAHKFTRGAGYYKRGE